VEGIRNDFALLLLRFELLDERGKTTGRGVATTSYSALRLFPMAQSQAALLGLRTARFLEGETWRDRITDLDRMVPILGLS
jgi:hypothetical protein